MRQQQVLNVSFVVVFLALLAALGIVFTPFLLPILWAMILARVAYPLHERLNRLVGCREGLSAGLLTFGLVALVIGPLVYLTILGARQGISAWDTAIQWVKEGRLQHLGEWLSTLPVVGTYGQQLVGRLVVDQGNLEQMMVEGGQVVATYVAKQGAGFAKDVVLFVLQLLLMLITLFFLFRDGNRLYSRLYRLIPLEEEYKARIAGRLSGTVTAVLRGTIVTALAQGTVAGVVYWLLGVPFAVFLGVMTGFLALIPYGGTGLVWGPVALFLAASGDYTKAVMMLLVGGGLIGFMDNLIYPWLVGHTLDVPPLLLLFAYLGGLAVFGFIGLFLGPILLVVVLVAIDIYEEEFNPEGHRIIDPHAAAQPLSSATEPGPGDSVREVAPRLSVNRES